MGDVRVLNPALYLDKAEEAVNSILENKEGTLHTVKENMVNAITYIKVARKQSEIIQTENERLREENQRIQRDLALAESLVDEGVD